MKKLTLSCETLRNLQPDELERVAGGSPAGIIVQNMSRPPGACYCVTGDQHKDTVCVCHQPGLAGIGAGGFVLDDQPIILPAPAG